MTETKKQPSELVIESSTLLADAITNDLFTDGSGKTYDRLVMENEDGTTNNCGWGKFTVRARILKHLTANATGQTPAAERTNV